MFIHNFIVFSPTSLHISSTDQTRFIHTSTTLVIMQRPTNLPTNTERTVRYNVDNIQLTPSPMPQNQPYLFRSGMLFDSHTFDRVQTEVNNSFLNVSMSDEILDDNETSRNNQVFNDKTIEHRREQELRELTQRIIHDRPKNDSLAEILMQQLNQMFDHPTSVGHDDDDDKILPATTVNQTGPVASHDRPHADYGHLDRRTIAQEFQFNLLPPPPRSTTLQQQQQPLSSPSQIRLNAKSFAITAWTDVPKEAVADAIKEQFGIDNIQYICIGEEISELNHRRHLHIQIILKEKVNKKQRFLDSVTQTHCNYQVTRNDRAWNEYIRKGDDFIEFGIFQSVTARGQKHWPSSSSSSPAVASSVSAVVIPRATTTTTTAVTTVRAQAEQRRQYEIQISNQAFELAKTNVDQAMDLIQKTFPTKFITHSSWYLNTFNYIHKRKQQERDRHAPINKQFIWPHSFPDCTPQLKEAMDRWILNNFTTDKRAKCLIIIGPTRTGKTSFAMSLPGRVNYFKGRWNLDAWNEYARYSVYDDIPWDEFESLNYPKKKYLLTQNGPTHVTDKYRTSKTINVQQPAIVLLNPEDAGSLLEQPITEGQKKVAEYWQKNAFIYVMGPDEYFYKHRPQTRSQTSQNRNTPSNASSIISTQARQRILDEFEQMYQEYSKKSSK